VTALRSKKDFTSYEFIVETGEGGSKLLGLTTSRLRDPYGKLTGLIASFSDLTEMARMRQELQQQDRLAVVGELSAGLAHEIRNPVAAIRSAMDEFRRGVSEPKLAEKLAAIAVRESDHLNEIVTGFLNFAREPGRRREVLDVRGPVQEVAEQLQRKYAEAKGLKIEVDVPREACLVVGDETQLRQVFMNLGQNAVEAMQEKGELTVTVQRTKGPTEIRFDDRGPGIPPDKVARIFEPFYTDKERGVGMGLAICMRMVTAHDGTIQVASRPGGGTSIQVRLPAASEKGSA
jgi:two-component system sensor histidine kinase PilS (NtrC family)